MLAVAFQRILAETLLVPCATLASGCGGQATSSTTDPGPGSSGASNDAATGAASGASGSGSGASSGGTTAVSSGSSGVVGGSGALGGASSGCPGDNTFLCQCGAQPWYFVPMSGSGSALGSTDASTPVIDGPQFCSPTCPSGATCDPGTPGQGVWCHMDCTGRRPAGLLATEVASGTPLQVYFAEMARLEAASVTAFQHLRRQLVAHGAPRRLARAAERAARDEIQHARMTRALARRYGAVPAEPVVEPRGVGSLQDMAVENAVEGCVREAFGALVACWQARAATDPVIRSAMKRIARDETRHAALAFEVGAWVRGRLDARERQRVDAAKRDALDALRTRWNDAPASLRGPLGLPTARETRALAVHMARLAA